MREAIVEERRPARLLRIAGVWTLLACAGCAPSTDPSAVARRTDRVDVSRVLVALDDPVRKHLPEFRTADPRHAEVVTVRHLLTHRVGWDGDWLFCRPPADPSLDAIFERTLKES